MAIVSILSDLPAKLRPIRLLPVILSFLLSCTVGLAQANAQVANGGFETGYTSGWSHLQGNNGSSAAFSEETVDVHSGGKALKVEVSDLGTNAWDVQTLGPDLSLIVGEEYTLTYWAKSNFAGASIHMVVQGSVYLAKAQTLSTGWQQYSWTFTAAEPVPTIRIHYLQTETFFLDDFELSENSPPKFVPISIDPLTQHQEMVGFGGALSWYTHRVYGGDDANDAAIKQLMFQDLGIDVLRLKNWYYPVNYPASTDPENVKEQSAFNQTKDLYEAAKAANPQVQVLLSSWSPPVSLKSNNDRKNGGTLKQDAGGFMYEELAQYWTDCLDNLGWTPDYLSFQNEPGWVATWESCILEPTETASYAGYAEAADAIWEAIKDRPNAPKMIGSEAENVGAFFSLNTPLITRPYFAAHGYHTYNIYNASTIDSSDTISGLNRISDDYGNRPNWMTEWSNDGLDWLQTARVIQNTVVEADASAYIFWKLAWAETSNDTMIALQSDGSYEVRPHYYTIKHYAKHVDKGDRRIGITSGDDNVDVSGYLSADSARITLVVLNKNSVSTNIQLNHDSLSINTIEGYQSESGNFYQTMSGLYPTAQIALPAESITTLVLSLSEPSPPSLKGFTFDHSTNVFSINIAGAANTAYILVEASDLDFDNPDQSPIPLSGATAIAGFLNLIDNTIVTDANGNATVEGVSFGGATKQTTFIRAESAP